MVAQPERGNLPITISVLPQVVTTEKNVRILVDNILQLFKNYLKQT